MYKFLTIWMVLSDGWLILALVWRPIIMTMRSCNEVEGAFGWCPVVGLPSIDAAQGDLARRHQGPELWGRGLCRRQGALGFVTLASGHAVTDFRV